MRDVQGNELEHGDLVRIVGVDHVRFYKMTGCQRNEVYKVIGTENPRSLNPVVVLEVANQHRFVKVRATWLRRLPPDHKPCGSSFNDLMSRYTDKDEHNNR